MSKLVSWKKLALEKKKTFASWQAWHGPFFIFIRSCLQMLVTNIILVLKMKVAFTQFIPSRVDCVKTAHRSCIALFELLSGNCFCCHKLEWANKDISGLAFPHIVVDRVLKSVVQTPVPATWKGDNQDVSSWMLTNLSGLGYFTGGFTIGSFLFTCWENWGLFIIYFWDCLTFTSKVAP
jgi:hypothetical protein